MGRLFTSRSKGQRVYEISLFGYHYSDVDRHEWETPGPPNAQDIVDESVVLLEYENDMLL